MSEKVMPASDGIKRKIREFITSNFYVSDAARLEDHTSLLDSGVVDSTGVLEVVTFLEEEFDIEVADADLVPENLDSIEKIRAYVERRGGTNHDKAPH